MSANSGIAGRPPPGQRCRLADSVEIRDVRFGEPCWPVVRSTGGRTFCVRGFTCSVTPAELFSTGVSVIHRINELLQKDFRPPTFHRSWVRSLLRKGEHHGTG